jgi:hypothetical protein
LSDSDFQLIEAEDTADENEEDEEPVEPEELRDGYWADSSKPKNFWRQMLLHHTGTKRKRGDDDNTAQTSKRAKTTHISQILKPLTKPPQIKDKVHIHYTEDCSCKAQSPRECNCDVWYEGTVVAPAESTDPTKVLRFAVRFKDGDEEEIKWEIGGNNFWWGVSK